MSTTIAMGGKGGTGKTLVAALLIRYIIEKDLGTVLAIDADPSSNLNLALDLPLFETVGSIREEALQQVQRGSFPQGISKGDYLDLRIYESLVESEKVDLLAMGRPEGPGCYCAANSILRLSIDRLGKQYDYVVIDCEAGMEHLSRRTIRDVDLLLLVTDPTVRGVLAAGRMEGMAQGLDTRARKICLVVNMVEDGLPPTVEKAIAEAELELCGIIPRDPLVAEYDALGKPLVDLPPEAPVSQGIARLAESLGDTLGPSQ